MKHSVDESRAHDAHSAREPIAIALPAGTHLHLPDAPRGAAGPSRQLPEVRHDIGAGAAGARRDEEPRTDRLPPTLLVDTAADSGRYVAGHVRPSPAVVQHGHAELGRTRAVGAHRAVGGRAFLPACGAIGAPAQPEHVDAHRTGHCGRLRLQRRRRGGAWRFSGLVSGHGPRGGLLRGRSRDHLADAARSDPRIEGALADLGSHQVAARPRAEDCAQSRARRRRIRRAAGACACRRPAARAARREGPCRWRGGRGQQRTRRVDADWRALARHQTRGGQASSVRP